MNTTAELARLAGISKRMIQWWVENGVIKPRRRRPFGMRFFDDDQVLKVLIVRELRRRNVSLKKIGRLKLTPARGDYLVIIRNRVEWANRQTLIEHIKRVHSPVMLISIPDLRSEYAAAMERPNTDGSKLSGKSVPPCGRLYGSAAASPPERAAAA